MARYEVVKNALDSYFLNTANNTLNIQHLNDCILNVFDIEYRHTNGWNGYSKLHYMLINKRRPIKSLIWQAFMDFTYQAIENAYYPTLTNYRCTTAQLNRYLAKYNLTYSVFTEIVQTLTEWREEALQGVS